MKQRYAHCMLVLLGLLTVIPLSAQEIIRFEGKYMLLDHHNEVITPGFDSIVTFNEYERHYAFQSQGKWAIVKKIDLPGTDWTALQPKYDFIRLSQSYNSNVGYIVGINGRIGALSRSLRETVSVAYDEIFTASGNGSLTAIRKGNKLALITRSENNVFADQSFRFVYDELLSTPVYGILSFRTGTKYGFSYSWNSEVRLTEAVYDTPLTINNIFFQTKQNGRNVYFYSENYFRHTDTVFFRLEVGDSAAFVHLGTFSRMTIAGSKRTEKCYYNYPNVLVGIDHTDRILAYDLEKSREMNAFPAGGALYSFETLELLNGYYSREYKTVCFVKTRVHSTEGETLVTESYTELRGMNTVVKQDLPFEYTLVLKEYELNGDYLCVRQQDQYGEMNSYKRYFMWDSGQFTFTAVKPDRDYAHRRSSGGGGGSKDWMNIFWMGGR